MEEAESSRQSVRAWLVDNLVFTDVTFSRQTFQHDIRHTQDTNFVSLQLFRQGSATVLFGDAPCRMAPGEVHIFDLSREFHSIAENSAIAGVIIPHSAIGYEAARHPPHMSFAADSSIGRFLKNVFFSLLEQLPDLQQEEARAISSGFCGL